VLAGVAVFALSGCGGGDDYYDDEIKYHLVDQNQYGVSDIEYTCDGTHFYETDGSGGFFAYPHEDCSLRLDISVDSSIDRLFIIDDYGYAVTNIYYECFSGTSGYTDYYGNFEFDNVYNDDICTFFNLY